jgi:hypothetical protein
MRPRSASVFSIALLLAACSLVCSAQEFRIPDSPMAGEEISIATEGSGKATFYLSGPGVSHKSDVNLGEEVHLSGKELRNAGAYLAVVCLSNCVSKNFYVSAAKPFSLAFLVHPSRVPVSHSDAVSGVAFPFDQFHNLVQAPVTINFQLIAGKESLLSRSELTKGGLAWFRTASGKSAGMLQVNASINDDVSAKRAVQQVASEPCNLRITGSRTKNGIVVQTEPVHDCAGNVVSDGTVVTFTASSPDGKSTVDAPIKQGVARAQIETPAAATISVASGIVMGNELRIGGQQ